MVAAINTHPLCRPKYKYAQKKSEKMKEKQKKQQKIKIPTLIVEMETLSSICARQELIETK